MTNNHYRQLLQQVLLKTHNTTTVLLSIYLSILWAGVQPTLDPYAEAFL